VIPSISKISEKIIKKLDFLLDISLTCILDLIYQGR
jgi:hypothetical protein